MKITLCGSARFEEEFHYWNKELTLNRCIVYSLTVFPSYQGGEKNWYSDAQKIILDLIHYKKIDNSDAIFVITQHRDLQNKVPKTKENSYIGESTLKEIEYALISNKQVYYDYGNLTDMVKK